MIKGLKRWFGYNPLREQLREQSELILKTVGDVLYDYGLYSDKVSIFGRYQFPLKLGGSPFVVGGWLKIPIETRLLPKAIFIDDLEDEKLLSALRSATGHNVVCRFDSGLILPNLFIEKPKQGLGLAGVTDFWYLVELDNGYLRGIPRIVSLNDYPSPIELEYESLPVPLGITHGGIFRWLDLYGMRSSLVCGATRTGKSVFIRSVLDYLFRYFDRDCFQAYLLDLKFGQVEFQQYKKNQGVKLYDNAVRYVDDILEMTAIRFEKFISPSGCKSIIDYNKISSKKLPYVLCVIDEFAVVRTVNKKLVARFELAASQSVGAGIVWMIATQRPSVDVVSGSLKANVETRIGFSFSSATDTKTVFDTELPELVRVGCPGRGLCLSGDQILEFQGAFVE